MRLTRLIGGVAALTMAAAAVVASTGTASAAVMGETDITLTGDVTNAALAANVSVYARDPGGQTVLMNGKIGTAFPITGAKGGEIYHEGNIILTHAHSWGVATVVLHNLRINQNKKKISARVTLNGDKAGRINVFTYHDGDVKPTGIYNVHVMLKSGIASVLNSTLGVHIFADKMKFAKADIMPAA